MTTPTIQQRFVDTREVDPCYGPPYPLDVLVDEDTPEAPSPSPKLTLFMLLTENDVASRGDGGKLLFQEILRGQNVGYVQDGNRADAPKRSVVVASNFVISAAADSFMLQYPWKGKRGKADRPYRLTLEECSWDDVPPDPAAPKPVPPPSARELLAQALDAARREGDTTLAGELQTKLAAPIPTLAP